ncbi:hypothetical protein NX059_003555 [Plenodomus lindquistii]|nr:hypothetical protein NX059_003555 [Plenodomus lindquistii]
MTIEAVRAKIADVKANGYVRPPTPPPLVPTRSTQTYPVRGWDYNSPTPRPINYDNIAVPRFAILSPRVNNVLNNIILGRARPPAPEPEPEPAETPAVHEYPALDWRKSALPVPRSWVHPRTYIGRWTSYKPAPADFNLCYKIFCTGG